MPTVFLSYAREDLDQARRIERELAAMEVSVWRDQEQLRTGQNWPKALGEAIAGSDALLLLWSRSAVESTFVEFEWSTALALKKAVFPCLLENVPLPPSLAAIEAIQPALIPEAARKISVALGHETKRADKAHTQKVIRQLGEIGVQAPSEVLQKAKAAFAQDQWTVHGVVYQAAGDINIATPPPPQKTMLEKWQARVAIVVGVLTAVSIGFQLVRSNAHVPQEPQTHAQKIVPIQKQLLAGSIWDDTGEPLSSVNIAVLLDGKTLASGATDALGRFSFRVAAPPEAEVVLLAQRDLYHTEKRYTHLGNPGFNFKMRRKQE
jgi:TIR domain